MPKAARSSKTKKRTQRVAVIGAGAWGKNLIRNFNELGALGTICDVKRSVLESRMEQYPGVRCTDSYQDVLRDTGIAGVVVATPAATHYALARQALEAGKHVYVEKPLALRVDEARELIDIAEKRKLVLMVGHILRYHSAVVKLKELVGGGELGKIQYVYSNRLNIGKIRNEENILWSFAPHDISVILYLLDELPHSISATGGSYLQKDIADVTLTTMGFPSGVRSHIFVSWLHPFKEQKLVVVGDRKMAFFDDLTEEKLFVCPHKIEWRDRIPVAFKADAEVVSVEMAEPLRIECQHFLDCVRSNQNPVTDGNEGLRVLQILTLAQESLNTGGATITLDSMFRTGARATEIPYFVHPSAFVESGCSVGNGTKIWHNAQIQAGAQIGNNCIIGHNCFVGSRAKLGNFVKLESNIDVWDLVTIEDYVFIGPSAVLTNDLTPRARYPKKRYPEYGSWIPTLIREGASVGANATIVCGITIGRNALVGAGAVVTKDVPDYAVVVGVPGKVVGWICECGSRLSFPKGRARCTKCSRQYDKRAGKVLRVD